MNTILLTRDITDSERERGIIERKITRKRYGERKEEEHSQLRSRQGFALVAWEHRRLGRRSQGAWAARGGWRRKGVGERK